MKIAIQLYTLRDNMSQSVEETLAAVSKMGYDGVEFAGLYGKTGEEMLALCKKYSLEPISAHISVADSEKPEVLSEYAKIGIKYAVIPGTAKPDEENYREKIRMVGGICDVFAKCGFIPGYHNHSYELEREFEGERYLDLLFSANPDIKTELDFCWLKFGGGEPLDYINKYAGRVDIIHTKDFVSEKYGKTSRGIDARVPLDEGLDFDQRPVGDGVIDAEVIVSAAKKVGTEWLVVELDTPQRGMTALECAARSVENLKKLI